MKPYLVFLASTLLVAPPTLAAFETHEWGTFTSLVGSDGVSQHGPYHEDEKLPDFVHGFGETQEAPLTPFPQNNLPCFKGCFSATTFQNNRITQKMETPVIYFYGTPPNMDQRVTVKVDFPEGVITETFAAPISSFPKMNSDFVSIRNGTATFDVRILGQTVGRIPYVDRNNIYNHARNTQSQIVSTNNEFEKFIFYRGIGRFQPKVAITSDELNLKISAKGENVPSAVFLVSVNEQGQSQMIMVPSADVQSADGFLMNSKDLQQMMEQFPASLPRLTANPVVIRNHLMKYLVAAGLKVDEAEAMIKTWENGYLKTPGLRVLYIVPRAEVDRILPLQMTPSPDPLVRAFVARIEVMPKIQEEQLIARIEKEGSQFNIASLGRFAEPRLRRVLEVYTQKSTVNPKVSVVIEQLIQKSTQLNASTDGAIH